MPERPARKLLIVGWDAADWKLIDPLIAEGQMPHLKRLIDSGVRGDLSTLQPILSPLLWTSIATGKTADKHGVLNFVEPDPNGPGLRVACSTTRRTKALWNILGQSGLRSIVVSWYASHPAEPIRGACVSNLFQEGMPSGADAPWPILTGSVHPADALDRVAALRLHAGEVAPGELEALAPGIGGLPADDRRRGLLARLLAQGASVHNVVTDLMSAPWDCAMVYHETIDVIGHHFMQYHPPRMPHVSERDFEMFGGVMPAVYRLHDLMLGRLLELAGPETTVIVLSDHGFHSDHLRPRVQPSPDDAHAAMDATWHRPLGMVVMSGPGVKRGETVYGASLLDIAPTALTLMGLPVGADMDGRVLVETLERAPAVNDRVFTWDAIEGDGAGQHPPDLRVDPFEAADAVRQLADLGYVEAPAADAAAQRALAARETRFNLAIVYMTTRRVAQAVPLFETLHRETPGEPRFVLNLAQCYHNMGRFAEARALLEGFLRVHPGHADAKLHLGAALFAEQKLVEAGRVLEELERESPGRTDLDTMLGMVYVFLRRYDDAHRLFSRAASTDPHEPRAHHGLALVAAGRGQLEAALDHVLTALELLHFFPDAHHTLGVILTWMKDYDRAIQSFQVAVAMQPGLIDSHRYLASIYRLKGDRQNAPRHRDAAERLLRDRAAGGAAPASLVEGPLGLTEWERQVDGRS